ncbi:unnamed protein product, partial [Symbiodinium sp. KB8]
AWNDVCGSSCPGSTAGTTFSSALHTRTWARLVPARTTSTSSPPSAMSSSRRRRWWMGCSKLYGWRTTTFVRLRSSWDAGPWITAP